jgi:hypothetical protein
VRQLAAAFLAKLLKIEGGSKLPHSQCFASGKDYAALD